VIISVRVQVPASGIYHCSKIGTSRGLTTLLMLVLLFSQVHWILLLSSHGNIIITSHSSHFLIQNEN